MKPPAGSTLFILDQRSESYLQFLHDGGSRRLVHAQAYGLDVPVLVQAGYLRVLHGVLGPVVTLGSAGLTQLGLKTRPIAGSTATHQVALREAVELAYQRGYTPATVTSKYVRLRDAAGHDHYLYVRVNSLPHPKQVYLLLKHHRSGLRRGAGTVILAVLTPERYALQQTRQPRLQVWSLQ